MPYVQKNNPFKKKSDKHPFYPSDDPIIKRRLKEDEEKHKEENKGIQEFRNKFEEAIKNKKNKKK